LAKKTPSSFRYIYFLLVFLVLACQPAELPTTDILETSQTKTPFYPDLSSDTTQTPSPQVINDQFWINPLLPDNIKDHLNLPQDWNVVDDPEQAAYRVDLGKGGTNNSYWIYALVAPFSTIQDEMSFSELLDAWLTNSGTSPILLSDETLAIFTEIWGTPHADAIQVLSADQLLSTAWQNQPSLALIPFEEIEAQWKVISVDGLSPIRKEFDPSHYMLAIPLILEGDFDWPIASNRDPHKLTTIAITGVTALVRATAFEMNRSGVIYPAEEIGSFLASADITHISNEVPFWSDCPAPDPFQRNLIFCSDPDYLQLLEEIGTDIVELTGDHFNDYGEDAMSYTLDLYDDAGIPYYGGGRNAENANAAWTTEHNGNLIAFIGCNGKRGGYATADEDSPGTVDCDYAYLAEEIERLHDAGYLVITTFQHDEIYTFIPQPGLIRDFTIVAEAGSAIVSGSQAHHAHGMEFTDQDTLIMYGLGNLFFDQKGIVDFGDSALIARHVFYDGRYLNTEIFTIFFIDFAKPRFMTENERVEFLNLLFDASRFDILIEGS
jgi:poly-gamma-glutamate synthesis protein (capsule biosynthesis protein)